MVSAEGIESANKRRFKYLQSTDGTLSTFYRELVERLSQARDIISGAIAQTAPSSPFDGKVSVFYPGQAPPPEQRQGGLFDLGVRTDFNPVSRNYFETLSIPLIRGRDFTMADDENSAHVCIISESLAQRLWPNAVAVGQWLDWPPDNGPTRRLQVIGVAGNTLHRSPLEPAPLMMYVPILQEYTPAMTILLHARGDDASAEQRLVREVSAIDGDVTIHSVRTLKEQVQNALWQQRIAARLLALFGGLAFILSSAGLYGLVSYLMTNRTRELGVRMALGAQRGAIVRLVLQQSFAMVWIGLAVGMTATWLATRTLQRLLFGVSPMDARTLVLAVGLLCAAGLLAASIPARRASRVDPMVALRHD